MDMSKYIAEIVEWWGTTRIATTPATEDLFDIGTSELLTNEQSTKYHSRVAKCLF